MATFEEILTQILTQIFIVIEKILPVLLPFMAFILPPVIWLGQFMRVFIGEFLYPYFPLDPAFQNLTPWYIIGGSVGLVALILLFIRPDRAEKDE